MLFLEKIICLEFYFLKFKIFNLWTRRSNQSILKINPGISLEGMMLKLKLQYFATSCEELTHWKRLWCWEGLGAGEEGDNRGWDGWMTSLTRWMWVWVNSGSWWWGRPGVLQFMGSQRVRHDWETELNQFTGRTDAEPEALILWPPNAKSQLIGAHADAGKDGGQENGQLRMTEDEMVGWHYRLNGQ